MSRWPYSGSSSVKRNDSLGTEDHTERKFSGNKFAPRIDDVSLTVNNFSFEEGKLFVLHKQTFV